MAASSPHGLDLALSPTRFRRLFVGFLIGALLIVWVAFFASDYFIRSNAEASRQELWQSDALLLEDHATRTLDGVAARLRSAAAFTVADALQAGQLSESVLYELIFDNPVVRSLSLVDHTGQVVASSARANVGLRLPADTLPAPALNPLPGDVRLGRVYPTRDLATLVSGEMDANTQLWLASTPVKVQGQPWHWVAVVNTGIFRNFWARVNDDSVTEVALVDYEGARLVTHQRQALDDASLAEVMKKALQDRALGQFDADVAGRYRVSYRASLNHPVVLALVSDQVAADAKLAGNTRLRLLLAAAVSLLVIGVLALMYRWYLRYEASLIELSNQVRALGAHVMVSESSPDGRILRANKAFLERTGYTEAELIGQNHRLFNTGFHGREVYQRLWDTVNAGRIWQGLFRNRTKAGSFYWVNATIVPFTDAWGKVSRFVCLYSDITEAITLTEALNDERRLRHEMAQLNKTLLTESHTDVLTGLSNRRGFERFGQEAWLALQHYGRPVSLLMLDLDHFKTINDANGHLAGDEVLREMARRWRRQLRSSDLLARVGGEEFCVLLPNTSAEQAHEVAEKLLRVTAERGVTVAADRSSMLMPVTVSIGLASATSASQTDLQQLVQQADQALYAAKAAGRDCIQVYGSSAGP